MADFSFPICETLNSFYPIQVEVERPWSWSAEIAERIQTSSSNHYYYAVPDGSYYNIILKNPFSVKCDAQVAIDGTDVGTWRLNGCERVTIKRPANVDRRFRFVSEKGTAAVVAGVEPGVINNGLITVDFTPERQYVPIYDLSIRASALGAPMRQGYNSSLPSPYLKRPSFESGATILAGPSNQQFGQAERIRLDGRLTRTFHVRLVCPNIFIPECSSKYSAVPPRFEDTQNIVFLWN